MLADGLGEAFEGLPGRRGRLPAPSLTVRALNTSPSCLLLEIYTSQSPSYADIKAANTYNTHRQITTPSTGA